ncbi:hypothetical protein BK809_0000330 [Diplodia seriata]|uniref:Uncharacterized protein n=1 Tax=Diplodia seriata TaxID=420778 RepID=A0A1S8BAF8_9PEZI|nr:hypothetical protein BK809_0000330 [Diplodia seriata]
MLDPPFQRDGGPRRIELPEDDPFAMHAICAAIHSRDEKLPETLTPKQLLAIAYAAQKYDLIFRLRCIFDNFISLAMSGSPLSLPIEDAWDIMVAAYILQNAKWFYQATANIVLRYNCSFLRLGLPCGDLMPADIIYTLEEKRNHIRLELIALLYREAAGGRPNDCRCGWNAQRCLAWMRKLEYSQLSPNYIAERDLSWTFSIVENISDPVVVEDKSCSSSRWHVKPSWRTRLLAPLKELKVSAGILLESFRSNRDGEWRLTRRRG